jgi:hypothetical protein
MTSRGLAFDHPGLERKRSLVTVEQDTLGGTVAHFPRGKLVMTAPALLPLVGMVKFRDDEGSAAGLLAGRAGEDRSQGTVASASRR